MYDVLTPPPLKEDAQYIDDLTAQFERTFSALLESNPDLALSNVEAPSLDNSPRHVSYRWGLGLNPSGGQGVQAYIDRPVR